MDCVQLERSQVEESGASNGIWGFATTRRGIDLVEPYVGSEGVPTGAARVCRENRERAAPKARDAKAERAGRLLARKREVKVF